MKDTGEWGVRILRELQGTRTKKGKVGTSKKKGWKDSKNHCRKVKWPWENGREKRVCTTGRRLEETRSHRFFCTNGKTEEGGKFNSLTRLYLE